ncbi:MAG TPA: tyrosine-type recombinase/integrase [Kineosporiaceae bacterium]|nr:tyrosine-type recombinase/integrase [Kineosporiaceae bacterium]
MIRDCHTRTGRGTPDVARLSALGAHDILDAIADAARPQDHFTSHVLRHTFARHLVRRGHDLVLVAKLPGHDRLDTVRTYSPVISTLLVDFLKLPIYCRDRS